MKRTLRRHRKAFDIMLGLNVFGTLGLMFGAKVADADISTTILMAGINTVIILIARIDEIKRIRKGGDNEV